MVYGRPGDLELESIGTVELKDHYGIGFPNENRRVSAGFLIVANDVKNLGSINNSSSAMLKFQGTKNIDPDIQTFRH